MPNQCEMMTEIFISKKKTQWSRFVFFSQPQFHTVESFLTSNCVKSVLRFCVHAVSVM